MGLLATCFPLGTNMLHRPIIIIIIIIINNDNWTKWSAIWFEIIRVILKLNKRVERVPFEITSMIPDQNCTTRSSITTLCNSISYFIKDLKSVWLCCSRGAVLVFLFHWLGKKMRSAAKNVRFGNKSHRWEPIRLHGSPVKKRAGQAKH